MIALDTSVAGATNDSHFHVPTLTLNLTTRGPARLIIVAGDFSNVVGAGLTWNAPGFGGYWWANAPAQISGQPVTFTMANPNGGSGVVMDAYFIDNANIPVIAANGFRQPLTTGGSILIPGVTTTGIENLLVAYALIQPNSANPFPGVSVSASSPFGVTSQGLPAAGSPFYSNATVGFVSNTTYPSGTTQSLTINQSGIVTPWYAFVNMLVLAWPSNSSSSGLPNSSSSSFSPSSSSSASGASPVSSSSSASPTPSLFPAGDPRQCIRLAHPAWRTEEQTSGNALQITAYLSLDLVNRWSAFFPNMGPDTVTINYVDALGQPATFSFQCALWFSDAGYAFLSADMSKQFLIANVNGPFFDANFKAVAARNVASAYSSLVPCANPRRYDAPVLLPNQVRPANFLLDGILIQSFTSNQIVD